MANWTDPKTWTDQPFVPDTALNVHLRDNSQYLKDRLASYLDLTDTWSVTWTGVSANPAIGNGTLTGTYAQIGRMVFAEITLTAGSTTTFGTGSWRFDVPADVGSGLVGHAVAYDDSSGLYYPCSVGVISSTTVTAYNHGNTATGVTSAAPFAWTTSDKLLVRLYYISATAPSGSAETWTTPRTWLTGEQTNATKFNTDVRDNLSFLHAHLSTGPYEPYAAMGSYSPTWSVDSGSAPSVGNGTLSGSYLRLGSLVFFSIGLVWGSTTSAGTGNWTFTLPVAATRSGSVLGVAHCLESGVSYHVGAASYYSASAVRLHTVATGFVGAGVPFTWGTADEVQIYGCYIL